MVVGLGRTQIVLGMLWLAKHNPRIDWVNKTILLDDEHIRKTTLSTELTIATNKDNVVLPPSTPNMPMYLGNKCSTPFLPAKTSIML